MGPDQVCNMVALLLQDADLIAAIERSHALNRMELLAGWQQTNFDSLTLLRRQLQPYAGAEGAGGWASAAAACAKQGQVYGPKIEVTARDTVHPFLSVCCRPLEAGAGLPRAATGELAAMVEESASRSETAIWKNRSCST